MRFTGIERLRYLLATAPKVVITGCLLLSLIGVAGAGVTYANPPVVEVSDQTDHQTIQSTLETRAVVEQDTTMYARGEALTNHPVYLREPTPNVTVTSRTATPAGTDVHLDQRLFLIYEARSLGGEVFWHREVPLAASEEVSQDGEATVHTTLQISAIERELGQLQREVGDAGEISVHLGVRTAFETPAHDGELDDRGPITIRGDSYELPALTDRRAYSTSVPRERPIPSRVLQPALPMVGDVIVPHTTLLFAMVTLAGLLATGMCTVWMNRNDPVQVQTAIHEARYDDWISGGSLPETLGKTSIRMDSVEELVDVAIDMEKRVVHDTSQSRYAVIDGDVVYVYSPRQVTK